MDISTNYLGKHFENPFLLASGPPTANAEMIKRAFEAGWSGAVIKTLIQEPVRNIQNRFAAHKINKKIYAFENLELLSERTPELWYKDIHTLKDSFPNKVLIASIMGDSKHKEQWLDLAIACQDAGADFLELNFSCPHGYPENGKGAYIGQSAEFSSRITHWLKSEKKITIPIIPKLTAAVADPSYIGEAVAKTGADGICAINTFPSIMGFDLKTLEPKSTIGGYTTTGGYSGPGLKPIALRCVNNLVKKPGLPVMACGGISSGFDAVEFMLLGAPVVQICTAVMINGYSIISQFRKELMEFMEMHQFSSVSDFLGMGSSRIRQFSELDSNYSVRASVNPEKCIGCKNCYVSCRDAGHSAISMQDGVAVVDPDKCRGCSLCSHICTAGAISMVEV